MARRPQTIEEANRQVTGPKSQLSKRSAVGRGRHAGLNPRLLAVLQCTARAHAVATCIVMRSARGRVRLAANLRHDV